jgi:glycosyltransferase involved in cell wall biosynthesis
MPLVSIITPLHDKGDHVVETVRSVLEQSLTDWEMIVVENGSTDDGPAKVRAFDDPRIRLVVSPRIGPGAARNFGLTLASGEWILFLDADDLLGSGYLNSRLSLLEKCPSADLLVGRWTEFSESQQGATSVKLPEGEGRDAAWLKDASIAFAPWAVHAAVVRRVLLPPNPWPEDLDKFASEDTAFWFPIVQGAHISYTRDASAHYRVRTTNSRNELPISRWTDAVEAATSSNIAFLDRMGIIPNPRRALFLMKAFESCYARALLERDYQASRRALVLSRHWLKRSPVRNRGVLLRKLLGIPLHQTITRWISRITKNTNSL